MKPQTPYKSVINGIPMPVDIGLLRQLLIFEEQNRVLKKFKAIEQ